MREVVKMGSLCNESSWERFMEVLGCEVAGSLCLSLLLPFRLVRWVNLLVIWSLSASTSLGEEDRLRMGKPPYDPVPCAGDDLTRSGARDMFSSAGREESARFSASPS
jgi:hypothetical protein